MKGKLKDELPKNHRLNHEECIRIMIIKIILLKQDFQNY